MKTALSSRTWKMDEDAVVPVGLSDAEAAKFARIPQRIGYMDHPSFHTPSADEVYFGESAEPVVVPEWLNFPEVPEDAQSFRSKRPALTGEEEVRLFLRYNYARCRLNELLVITGKRVSATRARQMILWHDRVMATRSDITLANMPLVLAMVRRVRMPMVEFADLISEGNMALLRSVEKFDVSRGFKFSTYACRAILKGFSRLATKTGSYRQHFPMEFDPDLEKSDNDAIRETRDRQDTVEAVREVLDHNRAGLSAMEKAVVTERFAIGRGGKGRTLAEVGQMVGLTNERVRQIQNSALLKLRAVLDDTPRVP